MHQGIDLVLVDANVDAVETHVQIRDSHLPPLGDSSAGFSASSDTQVQSEVMRT